LWAEPAVPDPAGRSWRDWALVAVIVPVAVAEGVLRDDLVWPVTSVVVAVALSPTLLWRRTHPLPALAVAFGAIAVVDVVSLVDGVAWEGLGTSVFVLLLLYALTRWGSGRDAVIGLAVASILLWLGPISQQIRPEVEQLPASDMVGGGLVLLVSAAVGASVRYRDTAHERDLDQIKLLEREQLARELHDTVAHHVSAIVIRAQAGRVVGASDPSAALDALAVTEEEASRTLSEMRAMVGALRQGKADLAPQRGIADIARLTSGAGERPQVAVVLSGDLNGLRPSIDAGVYRLAQESITNAVRHARNATRVSVSVQSDVDCVRLTVSDDGDPAGFDPRSATGFGLIGMAERAKLLGGALEAGPNQHRGWTVEAVLPKATGGS